MTPEPTGSIGGQGVSEYAVRIELQQQPVLFRRLAENALTVAESLRDNYFKNTAKFVSHLRQAIKRDAVGGRVMEVGEVLELDWASVQGEVVTFIDGGVGSVQVSSQVPILLRVGSYCVKTGERNITEREKFGYYPIVLGDLEGGSRERKDFIDVVRITAELLGGLSALERTPDLRVLMFHGPLVYLVGAYAGHAPFTERDIDLFLRHYAPEPEVGRTLKEGFLQEARIYTYPEMGQPRWADRRLFDPLAWMAYLYRRLVSIASQRDPRPLIAGVVERGQLREFAETCLLANVFERLRARNRDQYFNEIFGRTDLISPRNLLDRLGYTDGLLLAMLLRPGQYSEPWEVAKYAGLRRGNVTVAGDGEETVVDFGALRPGARTGFPRVSASYLQVIPNAEPVRLEVFTELGQQQMVDTVARAYLYAKLLPGYGFPVGLDIADKYAKVPSWLTDAYGKLIRHHLGVSLQRGEISDADMRRILAQAIYMTNRDWLFRPSS
jgi:hypothetical protein